MKSGKNSLEGQMDIFEAMNRAAAAVDKMVEEEDIKRKKNRKRSGQVQKQADTIPMDKKEPKEQVIICGCDMHASMQKTFVNTGDDDFSTVAYIDYNMVYWKDWNAPAALKVFENAAEAVDFYFEQLEKLRQCALAEPSAEHEPFCNVRCIAEHVYAECED